MSNLQSQKPLSDIDNKLIAALRAMPEEKALIFTRILLECVKLETPEEQLAYLESATKEFE